MTLPEKELRHILFRYADEKKTRFIVDAILQKRKTEKLDTTMKLLKIIEESSFDPKSPIRVFQALRIAVNDEFGHIERSFERVIPLMDQGGIIMVITFHSIEDRLVKNFFAPYLTGTQDDITGQIVVPPVLKKITKKPIEPTEQEIQTNPRSRSAKLRIYQKI
jgi:16S rRNA (cytosine1402-N4)-methyltransferase